MGCSIPMAGEPPALGLTGCRSHSAGRCSRSCRGRVCARLCCVRNAQRALPQHNGDVVVESEQRLRAVVSHAVHLQRRGIAWFAGRCAATTRGVRRAGSNNDRRCGVLCEQADKLRLQSWFAIPMLQAASPCIPALTGHAAQSARRQWQAAFGRARVRERVVRQHAYLGGRLHHGQATAQRSTAARAARQRVHAAPGLS